MNWTKTSAISEMVGSIAILATLGYLAVQTQQNTAALVSSSRQQALSAELEFLRMNMDYPESTLSGADPDEVRDTFMAATLIRIREHQWFQLQDGQLDDASFRSYLQVLLENLRDNLGLRELWNQWVENGEVNAGFAARVEDELNRDSSQEK